MLINPILGRTVGFLPRDGDMQMRMLAVVVIIRVPPRVFLVGGACELPLRAVYRAILGRRRSPKKNLRLLPGILAKLSVPAWV